MRASQEQLARLCSLAQKGDRKALGLVCECHHALVMGLVGLDQDLYQVAMEGIVKGVERFNPDFGASVTTHITYWIKDALGGYRRNYERMVRMPNNQRLLAMRLIRAVEKEEVREEDLSHHERSVLNQYRSQSVSLNAPMNEDGDSLVDILGEWDDVSSWERREDITALLADVDAKEQAFLYACIDSQSDVARQMGISRQRVAQIFEKRIKDLRRKAKALAL
jgi:RNA polymerase primary sigma factor